MILFAIETAAGVDRQYVAGSPAVSADEWWADAEPIAFARRSQTRSDGDRCSETLDLLEEGQAATPTAFTSMRLYSNAQLAQEALATLPSAHRWGGTAVALVASTTAHLWHVFKCEHATLALVEARREGCKLVAQYVFNVGAWVEEASLFDDQA